MTRFIQIAQTETVADVVTGLTWTRGYVGTGEKTYKQAEAAIKKLNKDKFCGFSDWRLPTVKEVFGIVDHTRYAPAIDTDAFECGQYDWVWTSTPYAVSSSVCAWIVYFDDGNVYNLHRDYDAFVRAVRGASPAGQ